MPQGGENGACHQNFYSKVWFNTPSDLWSALCSGSNNVTLTKFGIKPDGIINFLSNEPPIQKQL
jgi:hypothetical protein